MRYFFHISSGVIDVSGGAVRISLDQLAVEGTAAPIPPSAGVGNAGIDDVLSIVLDGIARRGS